MIKNIILISVFIMCCLTAFTQGNAVNAYDAEDNTYLMSPLPVRGGYVVTDNYANALYLISDGKLEKLTTSPGCGRYVNISSDRKKIGFKYIDAKGLQAPAVYDLVKKDITLLHAPADACGQPGFTADNKHFYSVGTTLYITTESGTDAVELGVCNNITAVSPDGREVIFSNAQNELVWLDRQSGARRIISEQGKQSLYPQWSPDGSRVVFQNEKICVWDKATSEVYVLGEGLGPRWAPDSKSVIFYKTDVAGYKLNNADLFLCGYKGGEPVQLTHTPDVSEMQPVFSDNSHIVYHTYTGRKIIEAGMHVTGKSEVRCVYEQNEKLSIDFYNLPSLKSEVRIPDSVPYIHQVYDTRDDHYGYGSCAPTTSMMAFAYYNRLPKWPVTCSSPYTHVSNYGNYISQKYTLNNYYYDDVAQTSGGDDAYGGYGYMWVSSPNSKMKDYTINHYFNSVQYWTSSCTITKTRDEINAGYPHSMCVMLTSSGHLILCRGYVVGQYTLIFSDPYGNKNNPGYPNYTGFEAYYDWPGYNNGYQNLDYNGSYGYVPWTVTNQGTEVTYNDTLIDDLFYNHGFNMNNTQNSSHMRYFHDANSGYNNHVWFTYSMASQSDICWVTWEPHLPQSGRYEVMAYIPAANANATGARYKITHAGGDTVVVVNQASYNDTWVSLGIYEFDTAMVSSVYLGDSTGIDDQSIAFDAVKWSYKPIPQVAFFANDTTVCAGDSVRFSNNTIDGQTYEWTFSGALPDVSTLTAPVVVYDTAGVYDVTLIAHGLGGTDTLTLTSYINVKGLPQALFTAMDTVVSLPPGLAAFINNSVLADTYVWNFGNGDVSTDANPWCIYDTAGYYSVTLHAASSCGTDTLTKQAYIHVLPATGISSQNPEVPCVYPNPFSTTLVVASDKVSQINLFNVMGQLLLQLPVSSKQTRINTASLPSGVYFLNLQMNDGSILNVRLVKEGE